MLITAISDTHNTYPELPGGDLLIHAGDFSYKGYEWEVVDFMLYLQKQAMKYDYVLFCAGNHEVSFEASPMLAREWMAPYLSERILYLQDEAVTILGKKIYMSPHTPSFGTGWAFNVHRGLLYFHWDRIPETDILVTHGPPYNYGDFVAERVWLTAKNDWAEINRHLGCEELLAAVARVKPKLHIFGHIHYAAGKYEGTGEVAGTTFVNASVLDERYRLVNAPLQIYIE